MHCCIEILALCPYFLKKKIVLLLTSMSIIIIYFSVCQRLFARRRAFSLVSQSTFRALQRLLGVLQLLVFEERCPNESTQYQSASFSFLYSNKRLCTYFQVSLQHPSHPIPVPPELFLCPRPKFLTKCQRSDNTQQPKTTSCSGRKDFYRRHIRNPAQASTQ